MFVICLGIYLFIRKKKKKQKRYATSHGRSRLEQLPEDTLSISHHEEDLDLPHYDFTALAKATNDFSFTHFLGEGGYGPVYRAWKLFKEGRPLELNDNFIVETCDLNEVMRSIHVGLLCVQHSPEDRPSMSAVVLMLSGEGTLPEPKEPGFFTERKLIDASSSSSKPESCSVNEVTITLIDPR
ncbi:RECEPTOR PROTEIN KINASE ZMPK1-RELATED [Salix purpurea]|uniref:RECEPTOR PROTEIN KINASE ZMPK1-RELATED n=1 Tax=Salix purpurea TaxID=77065 RepID=A0A9Q1A0D2_SALPP|nr:RECEPTOR PROTEIN KINASE ZMPK1-RELATED [Salix purpurea]